MNAETAPLDDARVAFEEGVAHHRAGRVTQALAAYARALAIDPSMSVALVNRAVGLNQLGRREEAMECLNQALRIDPSQPVSWLALGDVLKALGHADEAVTALHRALDSRPGFAPAVAGLADALIESGDSAEAEMVLDGLLVQNPGDWIAWQRLGLLHLEKRRTNPAIACLQRALAIKPDRDDVRMMLAQAFVKAGALAVAEKVYRDVLARHPEHGPALVGLAQTLIGQGQTEAAEPPIEQALAADPDSVDGRLARARLNFLAGRLDRAWPDYAWRKRHPSFNAPDAGRPAWDGSPLGGRRILLIAEQGVGDTIQFLRYVPMVARAGGRVFLAVPTALKKLAASVYGVTSVVGEGEPIPSVDVQAHFLDLPALFGTTMESVPAPIPYLSSAGPTVKLDPPAGTRLKVGLVWAGNPDHPEDERRSCPFANLQELLGMEGVAFYSLQTGAPAVDLARHAHPALIADLAPSLGSFADTAGYLAQLDLLITVDTAVVHLAGALGVPTFLMLAFAPDWRWRQTGEDTPWYPSLRLFRQRRAGDWSEVIRGVALGIREKLGLPPPGTVALQPSVFRRADGQPRYLMPIPQKLAEDVGVRYLVSREREFGGFEYPFRRFLDVHLEADDLFIDAGAHWGIMSLHAATHHSGKVTVLAIEPAAVNLGPLKRWIEVNNVTQAVEIVAAGLSDQIGRGRLVPESTMGLSIAPADANDFRSDTFRHRAAHHHRCLAGGTPAFGREARHCQDRRRGVGARGDRRHEHLA
jgi:tetratricopeptide (TPR) repeat protein